MSRPSKVNAQRLEDLETAAVHLADAMSSCGILAIHLRRVYRRVPELALIIGQIDAEMRRIVDDCDQAHDRLVAVLDAEQVQRSMRQRATQFVSSSEEPEVPQMAGRTGGGWRAQNHG